MPEKWLRDKWAQCSLHLTNVANFQESIFCWTQIVCLLFVWIWRYGTHKKVMQFWSSFMGTVLIPTVGLSWKWHQIKSLVLDKNGKVYTFSKLFLKLKMSSSKQIKQIFKQLLHNIKVFKASMAGTSYWYKISLVRN